MSRIRTPDGIEIASLKGKKTEFFDAMAPGPGTPWEDRGTRGVVSAFLKTCAMSLTSFFKLVDAIRRPETTNDAFVFLIDCCILWGVSAFIHGLIFMHFAGKVQYHEVETQTYLMYVAIAAVGAGGGVYLLFRLYNIIYAKLIAQEKTATALPDVLLYNVNAYALGPSILAPIPFIGPALAGLFIFIDLYIAGRKRLNIRATGALIDALMAYVVVLVVAFVGYWVGNLVLHQVLGDPIDDVTPKTAQTR
ncbi:MAG TPA: hypothetical protein VLI90_03595 [Tepidisphaeraceae bacterium]|nr:hypothetical protein [Tepidisphaeraceae bacterium]